MECLSATIALTLQLAPLETVRVSSSTADRVVQVTHAGARSPPAAAARARLRVLAILGCRLAIVREDAGCTCPGSCRMLRDASSRAHRYLTNPIVLTSLELRMHAVYDRKLWANRSNSSSSHYVRFTASWSLRCLAPHRRCPLGLCEREEVGTVGSIMVRGTQPRGF